MTHKRRETHAPSLRAHSCRAVSLGIVKSPSFSTYLDLYGPAIRSAYSGPNGEAGFTTLH
jgi:hypothetical protein